jgi:hypothetical protein
MSLSQWKTCFKATKLYTNSIITPPLEDEQKEYKFTTKIGQFFEELKVQSRTKIDNQRSEKIRILLAKKKCAENYSQEYLYPKLKP